MERSLFSTPLERLRSRGDARPLVPTRRPLVRHAPPFTIVSLSDVPAAEASHVFERHAAAWERARHDALTRPFDRRRYCHAHGALRLVLAEVKRCPVDRLAMRKSETGKPRVVGGPSFSLSYEGADAWLAIGGERPIGLDVVALTPGAPLDGLIASDADIATVRANYPLLPRPDLVVWAAKEAAAKLADQVERAPEAWRLRCEPGLVVEAEGCRSITVEIRHLGGQRIAAVGCATMDSGRRDNQMWGVCWT